MTYSVHQREGMELYRHYSDPNDGAGVKLKTSAIAFLCAVATAVGSVMLSDAAHGQFLRVAAPRLDFEVATCTTRRNVAIQPNVPAAGQCPRFVGGEKCFLAFLISNAYRVKIAQIYNGPGWIQ